MFRATWTGLSEFQAQLTRFASGSWVPSLLSRWAGEIIGRLRSYPPARTAYIRTGNLAAGWNVTDSPVVITNPVEYASFVQGDDQLALFEDLGWMSVTTVADEVKLDADKTILEIFR